jgi:hypothetical protein
MKGGDTMIHLYKGFHGFDSHCDIQINGNVVIATELNSNKGTSVTNFAEYLATEICKKYNIPMEKLVWIEHYEAHGDYDLVTFTIDGDKFTSPKWTRISEEKAKQIFSAGKVE